MGTIIDNMRILLPFATVSWTILLISAFLRPQKFRNSFLLLIALFFTVFAFAGLFGNRIGDALIVVFLICMAAIFLVPAMLIINGIIMIRNESFALAHILSLLLGIFVGAGEIALMISVAASVDNVLAFEQQAFLAFVFASVFYVSFLVLAFVIYVIFIQLLPHKMNYDYIVIHGCGLIDGHQLSKILSNRVDKAIKLYNKCKIKPIIIPSGGRGDDEQLSEAEAMRNYLLQKGIPEESIIVEDQSATTMENLINSKAIIDNREGKKKTALVSSNYHVYRCLVYASKIKFKCTGVGAKVALYYWPSAVIREFIAIFSMKKHLILGLLGYAIMVLAPVMSF